MLSVPLGGTLQWVFFAGKNRRGLESAAQDPQKKDAAAAESFKATLADKLAAISAKAEGRALRLGVLDEHRYGLLQ